MRQIDARAAEAPTLVVGIAQGNQPVLGRHEGFKIHRRLTNALRDREADLVVWSEGSVQEVFDDADYQETAKKQITRFLRVPVLFGAGVVHRDGDRKREHNTALLAEADGSIVGRYDKQFLLPFGEYIPFGETFPSLYASSPHSSRLSPGTSMEPMQFRGYRISTIICYEDILPGFVNRLVSHANPDLLVNITIDTWFGRTIEPWEHLGLARLRAVEHRRYLVRATNSGLSAIVDANGVVTMHGKLFEEEALLGEAKLMRGKTVYEVAGDYPFYGCAAAGIGMAMVRRRKKKASA
jgi:apolipoprotein N-acyltransferase